MATKKKNKKPAKKAVKKAGRAASPYKMLKAFALGFPQATEEHPWGDTAIKVRGKTFVFMGESAEGFGMSVKLPRSREFALDYPGTRPTPYGLGKSGWVSVQCRDTKAVPMTALKAWISESYRAIAPKKLAATLD